MTISELVNEYLSSKRLTVREFADQVGVASHGTVINWRDGRTVPPADLLLRLASETVDWRREFAVRALEVRYPGMIKSGG